jgi:hypothetical protein
MRRISLRVIVCIGVSMLSVVGVQAEPLASVRAAPDELTWKPPPLGAGLQRANIIGDDKKSGIYVYRIRFPAGLRVKPHFHPDERVVTRDFGHTADGLWRQVRRGCNETIADWQHMD